MMPYQFALTAIGLTIVLLGVGLSSELHQRYAGSASLAPSASASVQTTPSNSSHADVVTASDHTPS